MSIEPLGRGSGSSMALTAAQQGAAPDCLQFDFGRCAPVTFASAVGELRR